MDSLRSKPLGPQCLRCRKRRVKCDSIRPTCHRCSTDRLVCPGYSKPFVWVVKTPAAVENGSDQERLEDVATSELKKLFANAAASLPSASLPAPLGWSGTESWVLIEAVEYWNDYIIPDITPFPSVGPSGGPITLETFREAPKLLQHVLIAIVANNKIMKGVPESEQMEPLYKHRGQALAQLKQHMENSQKDQTITMVAIILLLQNEIQMSSISQWQPHLEAARSIMNQLNSKGLVGLWSELPGVQELLTYFLLIDVMSTTTNSVVNFSYEDVETQKSCICDLDSFERQLLSTCCPIPFELLRTVVEVNSLRAIMHRQGSLSESPSSEELGSSPTERFHKILRKVLDFDCHRWAYQIVEENDTTSKRRSAGASKWKAASIKEWTTLAQCYRSATAVYLIRSILSGKVSVDRVNSPIFQIFEQEAEAALAIQSRQLTESLAQLMEQFPSANAGDFRPQLWKFIIWPLFIDAYNFIGWISGLEKYSDSAYELSHKGLSINMRPTDFLQERLKQVGSAIGTRALLDAAVLLRNVQCRCEAGNFTNWDETFTERSVFII